MELLGNDQCGENPGLGEARIVALGLKVDDELRRVALLAALAAGETTEAELARVLVQ